MLNDRIEIFILLFLLFFGFQSFQLCLGNNLIPFKLNLDVSVLEAFQELLATVCGDSLRLFGLVLLCSSQHSVDVKLLKFLLVPFLFKHLLTPALEYVVNVVVFFGL